MSKQKYPEEFKIEAVKQITERGHRCLQLHRDVLQTPSAVTALPPELPR